MVHVHERVDLCVHLGPVDVNEAHVGQALAWQRMGSRQTRGWTAGRPVGIMGSRHTQPELLSPSCHDYTACMTKRQLHDYATAA